MLPAPEFRAVLMDNKRVVAEQRRRPRPAPSPSRDRWLCSVTLLLAAAATVTIPSANAFFIPTSTSLPSTTRRQMIGNVFGGDSDSKGPQLPKDIKDAISKCRGAVRNLRTD